MLTEINQRQRRLQIELTEKSHECAYSNAMSLEKEGGGGGGGKEENKQTRSSGYC